MNVQWWCSALGVPWTWTWRPYLGVWIFVALLASAYARAWRRADAEEDRTQRTGRIAAAAAGILLLWIALDWPVGTLGAGYLASVHMVQYILTSLAAPPLLLAGLPRAAYRRLAERPRALGVTRALTHPVAALIAFDLVTVLTHIPTVVDALMRSQLGTFSFDMAWLATGLMLWWPVFAPVPERPRFLPPLRAIYLFLATVVHMGIAYYLILSRFPVYGIYELAPPTGWISPLRDQQVAGGLMLVVGALVVWTGIAVVMFRWMSAEAAERTDAPPARPLPAPHH